MTGKTLIGVGGLLRSGKDTVADYLVEEYGYKKMGMSDPLLDMALTLNPRVRVAYEDDMKYGRSNPAATYPTLREVVGKYGYTEAKTVPEVRAFLQRLGTDVGRNLIDQDLWVSLAQKKILEAVKAGRKVVITGIRFPNELDLVNRLGRTHVDADTLWVERPSARLESSEAHASEKSVYGSQFRHVIINDGTLEDLYREVDEYMEAP